MNPMRMRKALVLLIGSTLMLVLATELALAQQRRSFIDYIKPAAVLPNPVLVYVGAEYYQANGKEWTRYNYRVENFDAYPNELFAASPNLPPCGKNSNAARTWVDFYEQNGKRLYGFCALKDHDGLNNIWFALERDVIPPSWIYIEMNDRTTNTKYKSNLADTVM